MLTGTSLPLASATASFWEDFSESNLPVPTPSWPSGFSLRNRLRMGQLDVNVLFLINHTEGDIRYFREAGIVTSCL